MPVADPLADLTRAVVSSGVAPAAAVAVGDGERTFERCAVGAPDDVLWQVGSIGKSFTAVLALQLAEAGELDLHAPVSDVLPWFAVRSRFAPITLHHLLTHGAGLILGAELATASTYDVLALRDSETGFAPGEHFWYSNVGYRVVGLALEAVTGQPYPRLVQERLLDPLGMRASRPAIVHEIRPLLAGGHVERYDDRPWRPQHGLVAATWIESAEADGSVCTTIEDLAVWLRAVWRGDGRLLGATSWATLRSPLVVDDQEGAGAYGYGISVVDGGFGHSGSMIGYRSMMWVEPADGLCAVACTNGIGGARALCLGALALAAGRPAADPSPVLVEPVADDGSCPPPWRLFLGHYRAHTPWLANFRVVAREGSVLLAQDDGDGLREPLVPLGEAEFRVGAAPWSPERLRFDTVVDGLAQRAVLSGGPYYRTFTP
jgi:CubicO group peptidase (beta-lactamase class C family)